jgi:tRNA(fMet)-specific endonuclease VapC
MKILDTDHAIEVLRGRLDLAQHVQPDDVLAVTAITVAELVHGVYRSTRPLDNLGRVDTLLAGLDIIPFDEGSARIFGLVKAQLQTAGRLIEDLDLQIASVALRHQATLVTHNQRHYRRVPALVLEDWV